MAVRAADLAQFVRCRFWQGTASAVPYRGTQAGIGTTLAVSHRDDSTNVFPSGSRNMADVPQPSFFGGCVNSTPRCTSS
jgi:hypothetical protein